MKRREFIKAAGGMMIGLPSVAKAQFNATRPITIIVPFPAGGGADILVRIVAKYMSENMNQPFVVQNMPGAGGALAFAHIARAAPDGHTLAWTTAGFAVMAATITNLNFDPKALVHIGGIAENPFVLVVNPEVPAKTVKELLDLAKEKPNALNFAHNGAGTLTNLVIELLKLRTGIAVNQVAYRGDNFSSADVIAGHVHAMFSNSPVALPHVGAGRLRGLAVTSAKRSPAAPDIPTMAEAGVADFTAVVWQGMSAPAGTPRSVVDKLNASAKEALQAPEVIERFKGLGAERVGSSPEQFAELVTRELQIWSDVVAKSGVKTK